MLYVCMVLDKVKTHIIVIWPKVCRVSKWIYDYVNLISYESLGADRVVARLLKVLAIRYLLSLREAFDQHSKYNFPRNASRSRKRHYIYHTFHVLSSKGNCYKMLNI